MNKVFSPLAAALAFAAFPSLSAAALFTADFETNQSANFTTVIASSTNDANANFTYVSSTHSQNNGPGIVIGAAPSGAATNNVLRLNANVAVGDTADVDSVDIYPNVTGLGPQWTMVFDAWQNYNGGAFGAGSPNGDGSTNFMLLGACSTAVPAKIATPIAGDGFWVTFTGENGATVDYRTHIGTGSIVANNNATIWMGGPAGTHTGGDAPWIAFFADADNVPPGPYESEGAMGKAWTTFKLAVNGTNATISAKRVGDAAFTDIGTIAGIPATATKPFIGFSDLNAGQPSVAGKIGDQFLLIDNLVIDNFAAGVTDWTVY